jgi:membrane protein
VLRRVASRTYDDGFIHAGTLADLALLAIFPFFILTAVLFALLGGGDDALGLIDAIPCTLPNVAAVIAPVAGDDIHPRSGWLLWPGAGVGLWLVSSLIETIRAILRRAYGTRAVHAAWRSQLLPPGLTLAVVVVLMLSLFA